MTKEKEVFDKNNQTIIDIVVKNKDLDDDSILSLMIPAGVSFSKARSILSAILVEQGLRLTKEQRDEKAEELMSGFEITGETTPDEVSEQIELIQSELECSKGIARNYVKAAFLDADVEMPKAASGGGIKGPRTAGFGGDVKLTADFVIANPAEVEGDREAFNTYMEENKASKTNKGKDKTARWYGVARDLRVFLKDAKTAGVL